MLAFVRKSLPDYLWPAPTRVIFTSPQPSRSEAPAPRIDLSWDNAEWENGAPLRAGPRTKALLELPRSGSSNRHSIRVVVVQATLPNSLAQPDITIKSLLEGMYLEDDVLSSEFVAQYAIVKQVTVKTNPEAAVGKGLVTSSDYFVCQHSQVEGKWQLQTDITCYNLDEVPVGPYVVIGNCIHEVWKLFPDEYDSFVCGIMPNASNVDKFDILNSTVDIFKAVAVPSRWYHTTSTNKPLNGLRVTVKDNFKIEGVKTTQMNRAWTDFHGPEIETAKIVTRLKLKGAIIIGKTKMCSFASSEEATDGWIDFHAPFNPRADGYQSSSGSTTGGATSLAGHDWVDISIGTDTTGSIRWPAAWHGLFGLRMTHNHKAIDMTGVYDSCKAFDALGLLGRSLQNLEKVAAVALNETDHTLRRPKRILFSEDFLPWGDRAQQAMVHEFVLVLEKFLGVKHETMSIAKLWEASPPENARKKSLREYIDKTAFSLFYYDGFEAFKDFRTEYQRKEKKPPYVGPYMRWKWEQGALVTKEQYDQAKKELEVYQRWFQKNVIGQAKTSDAILILPCGPTEPKYRDGPNKPPGPVAPFSTNYIASMIGLPQLVVPIGQLPYESRVSGREEYLPVVSTIVGPKNSDLDLIQLAAAALNMAGWATEVKTGELAFKLKPELDKGEVLCPIRNVVDPLPASSVVEPLPSPPAVDSLFPTPKGSESPSMVQSRNGLSCGFQITELPAEQSAILSL